MFFFSSFFFFFLLETSAQDLIAAQIHKCILEGLAVPDNLIVSLLTRAIISVPVGTSMASFILSTQNYKERKKEIDCDVYFDAY